MYEAAASCKDIVRAPVTNWEPRGVTLAGYCAVRYGMKVQLVTPYRVTHLQRYEVTLRGNVTRVYPPVVSTHIMTLLIFGISSGAPDNYRVNSLIYKLNNDHTKSVY